MSLIVAARFTTFPVAEDAAQKLFNAGFVEEDVTLICVNPRDQHARYPIGGEVGTDAGAKDSPKGAGMAVTLGAVAGAVVGVALFAAFSVALVVLPIAAGVGAFVGALIGAMARTRAAAPVDHHRILDEEARDSGVLVAVHVEPDNQFDAARVLREAGGATIERASGCWQQGRWADFDPRRKPVPLSEFNEERT
ncbi:conserved hypothetical protein [Paraburkholderia ribeironis]|uniref:Glycine zipper domain-containing protein n=1 Tax=Paraburkholderia ribeironis TaxID=1247936 RepID=A0A1N7S2M8_9BURK|nr:hypothetical protein [Paraburkholderia ribeironis]SIT41237.1 conserved hypothetical protein [Paraburkholderia ribeironis]